jgi:hypothetical protein
MRVYICAELFLLGLGGTNLIEIVTVSGLASILLVFRAHLMKVETALLIAWNRVFENMTVAELNVSPFLKPEALLPCSQNRILGGYS